MPEKTNTERVLEHFPRACVEKKESDPNGKLFYVRIYPGGKANLGFGWTAEDAWSDAVDKHGF